MVGFPFCNLHQSLNIKHHIFSEKKEEESIVITVCSTCVMVPIFNIALFEL